MATEDAELDSVVEHLQVIGFPAEDSRLAASYALRFVKMDVLRTGRVFALDGSLDTPGKVYDFRNPSPTTLLLNRIVDAGTIQAKKISARRDSLKVTRS